MLGSMQFRIRESIYSLFLPSSNDCKDKDAWALSSGLSLPQRVNSESDLSIWVEILNTILKIRHIETACIHAGVKSCWKKKKKKGFCACLPVKPSGVERG